MNGHLSASQICKLITGGATVLEETHARDCARCGRELARLREVFGALRNDLREWSEKESSQIDRNLWRGKLTDAVPGKPMRLRLAVACAAASLMCSAVLILYPWSATYRHAGTGNATLATGKGADRGPDERSFVPIPYTVPAAPYERAALIQGELPVALLVAAGFDAPAMDPGGTVSAELMVGQDGHPYAFRLPAELVLSLTGGANR